MVRFPESVNCNQIIQLIILSHSPDIESAQLMGIGSPNSKGLNMTNKSVYYKCKNCGILPTLRSTSFTSNIHHVGILLTKATPMSLHCLYVSESLFRHYFERHSCLTLQCEVPLFYDMMALYYAEMKNQSKSQKVFSTKLSNSLHNKMKRSRPQTNGACHQNSFYQ